MKPPTIAKRLLTLATLHHSEPTGMAPANTTNDTPADTQHEKLCDCRVPLLWDRNNHQWLHLNPRTPCPKRRARRDR